MKHFIPPAGSAQHSGWTDELIEAHMAHELTKAPPQSKLWPFRRILNPAVLLVGILGLAFVSGAQLVQGFDEHNYLRVFLGVLGIAGALTCFIAAEHTRIRGPALWNTYAVEDGRYYSKVQKGWITLPQFVRELMDSIKTVRPGTMFEVAVLEQDTFILDPVLYSVDGDKRTIELVWDKDIIPPPV